MPAPLIALATLSGLLSSIVVGKESLFEESQDEENYPERDELETLEANQFKDTDWDKELEQEKPYQTIPPEIMLRRGDRFTCPETGEELQVRAVGGRPKRK